jgi:hypothetical protein
MKFLDQEELSNNTILIFLTDNGSDVPNKKTGYTAGMRGFKGSLYEGGHRVPCFVRGPERLLGKPRVIDAFTAHIDLLPTFIDLCQLKKTDRKQHALDGRSLRPLLESKNAWPDRTIILHHHNGRKLKKYDKGVVLTQDWRLVIPRAGKHELYKIKEDRAQKHDIAKNNPDVVKKLLAVYDAHWKTLKPDRPLQRVIISKHATVRLSSDITAGGNPITQQSVRKAASIKPLWLLEVKTPGRFRFEVRRWPREADTGMTAAIPPSTDPEIEYIGHANYRHDVPGVALDIKQVELKLSEMKTLTKKVAPNAKSVQFDVELPIGPVDIEAWLTLGGGKRLGAYFVYVEHLE